MRNFWTKKNVMVTGATGFLGYWLTKALVQEGANVVVLVRDYDHQSSLVKTGLINKTRVVNGELESYPTLDRAVNEHEIDTVFHLGAQTLVGTALRNPFATFESNIRGSYNLFEVCRQHRNLVKRVVVASSDKAYGSSPVLPYLEDMPLKGEHPYDVSKSCTDLIAAAYHHTYGVPIVVARCGNIYGGGDLNWSRLIPGTIKSLYSEMAPVIRSDGSYTRDYLYVEDTVYAYMLLAINMNKESVQGQAFNFGPNKPYSVIEVVNAIQNLMSCNHLLPQFLNEAKEEIHDQSLNSDKARKLLGWEPQYSLEQGLQKSIAWYTNYIDEQKAETRIGMTI